MKKIFVLLIFFLASFTNANSEIKRIVSGDLTAKITIIAYESLTCSHCAALNAAKIAQCQESQSLEILETLYSNQQAWIKGGTIEEVNASLEKFLKDEGFSLNFNKCVDNKKIEDFVLNDRIEGTKNFEINATPTIIINNKKFEKSLNYKNLKKSLEKLI